MKPTGGPAFGAGTDEPTAPSPWLARLGGAEPAPSPSPGLRTTIAPATAAIPTAPVRAPASPSLPAWLFFLRRCERYGWRLSDMVVGAPSGPLRLGRRVPAHGGQVTIPDGRIVGGPGLRATNRAR
ncbi:hypothetical protein BJY14_001790 [Actinomadura luteofluorescens]|uniref:Uncharacterized protein n=1 Tax=Actinomadura luteofluorescens TaxID=46163 RepID=A0A7Y9EDV7_9ACTN|nr:hypothetical protein [Actinomadura luteofluorescens]NYD45807.1 hypothetical protein [Actinomadura luteofluorescens]